MIKFFIIFLTASFFSTLIGYWIHKLLHKKWTGLLYAAHNNHHFIQYPENDFLSPSYRNAGANNTAYLFAILTLPIFIILYLLYHFQYLPLITVFAIFIGLILSGWLHDYFHDMFHVSPCYWERFNIFLRLRDEHRKHHKNVDTNFGILFFIWDKLFNTYNKE